MLYIIIIVLDGQDEPPAARVPYIFLKIIPVQVNRKKKKIAAALTIDHRFHRHFFLAFRYHLRDRTPYTAA